jgi:ATP-dependent helicase/nuclease subunit A
MTIHKAKGLDFAHVYVPQMHKTSPPDALPPIGVGWGVGVAGQDRRLEYCLFGAPTPGFAAVAEEARRVEAAERVRTLYVAMTRAEERLVLLGRWPEAPAARPPGEAASFMELLGSRFEAVISVGELWQEAAGSGGRVDRHGARWVFPELQDEGGDGGPAPAGDGTARRPAAPDPAAVTAAAGRLRELRGEAAARSARPVGAPASEEAHRRLEELAEERFEEGGAGEAGRPGEGAERDRSLAMAAGTALHRVLEELDLAAVGEGGGSTGGATGGATGIAAELARHRERLPELLRPLLPESDVETAAERCRELLDRLERGGLLERLATLGGRVVARELPVLLPPDETAAAGPVGVVSGAVDLLYRDPRTDELVVADYKTDRVETPEELAERAGAYASQARLYARAVQEALGLPEPPRAELWFLWPGEVREISGA